MAFAVDRVVAVEVPVLDAFPFAVVTPAELEPVRVVAVPVAVRVPELFADVRLLDEAVDVLDWVVLAFESLLEVGPSTEHCAV